MYTSTSLKLVVDELAASYLVLVTFTGVHLYLQKLQVQELIICLNIQDLMCEVGVTVYTLVWQCTGNLYFLWSDPHKIQSKYPMRMDPFSIRVDLHREWSLKQ